MLLQATLNGEFTKAHHPAIPESVDELVTDALACVAAGARIGLEDTLYEPDGTRTAGNAALVRAAMRLGAGQP